ncbi:MAG: arginine--tRNA ligase, partial [Sphingomonadales bacterium]
MNVFNIIREYIQKTLEDIPELRTAADRAPFSVEPPRDPAHGDVATNVALVIAKGVGRNPRELAGEIAGGLLSFDAVALAEVAGPGFINLRLEASFWQARISEILLAGRSYGDSSMGGGQKVNVEYVSA